VKKRIVALVALVMLVCGAARAVSADSLALQQMDSVEISLLTCSPGQEVYSLYGHTAIRYHDLRDEEQDWAFSYGMFSFKKSFFVLRFMFGLTDYDLGVLPIGAFNKEYEKRGSSVVEQRLNLTAEEKIALRDALFENAAPENRTYRYNYFYDNCTSRARDIIERNMAGEKHYGQGRGEQPTWRQLVHRYTDGHRWTACGVDLLLGVKADMKASPREQQFLPEVLMEDFAAGTTTAYGESRPMVNRTNMVVKPGVQVMAEGFPFTPTECALALLVVSLLVMAADWKRRKVSRWFDFLLMIPTGLAGIIIFLMLFSQHPTTSTNLQIFLLNPLPLFMLCRRKSRWWWLWLALIVVFFIGGAWQDYAEGTEIVACCLLTRIVTHLKFDSEKNR